MTQIITIIASVIGIGMAYNALYVRENPTMGDRVLYTALLIVIVAAVAIVFR